MNEVALVLIVLLAIGGLLIALGVMVVLGAAGDGAVVTVTAPIRSRRPAGRRLRARNALRSHA